MGNHEYDAIRELPHLSLKQHMICDLDVHHDIKGDFFDTICINYDEDHISAELGHKILSELGDALVASNNDLILVCCHYPMYSLREKKGRLIVKDNILSQDLLNVLMKYKRDSGKEIIYLCAHTHCYQHIEFSNSDGSVSITQYVIGTGGAHPDFVTSELFAAKGKLYEINDKYNLLMQDIKNPFGYLDMRISSGQVLSSYVGVGEVRSKDEFISRCFDEISGDQQSDRIIAKSKPTSGEGGGVDLRSSYKCRKYIYKIKMLQQKMKLMGY